jgi:hypothetical protein
MLTFTAVESTFDRPADVHFKAAVRNTASHSPAVVAEVRDTRPQYSAHERKGGRKFRGACGQPFSILCQIDF